LEEDILERKDYSRLPLYALFGMAFTGVVVCCYVLIMMGTAFLSLGSMASASPRDEEDCLVLAKNLPIGCDTTLDTTLFEDIEGDPVAYEWYGPFTPASGPNPDAVIPEGTHAVSLLAIDGTGRPTPLTCYVRVEPTVSFSLHAKRGKVILDLPRTEEAQRLDIYRAPAAEPEEMRRIAQLPPDTLTYTDSAVNDTVYLYAVAVLQDGQWSFSTIRAAHPYGMLPRWNDPPVICSLPVATAQAGLPYTYDILAVDPQEDELTYSLDNPQEEMSIDPRTGLIEWLPEMAGDHHITVRVTDGKGDETTQTFILEVEDPVDPNKLPQAHAGGPYTAEVNQPVSFNGSGSYDPDSTHLSYVWAFGDGEQGTGALPIHTYAASGTYPVVLTVIDGNGGISTVSTTVAVGECLAPEINLSINPSAVQPGEPCLLVWTSEKADTLTMDQGIGEVGTSGTLMIYPEKTTTVTLTARGRCGTTDTTVVAMVHEPPVLDVTVTAHAIRQGETAAIAWTSSRAETVTIDQGVGDVMPEGTITVAPDKSTRYTITARGPGGSSARTETIEVLPGTFADIEASPSTIARGQVSVLRWTSSGDQHLWIDQDIGPVDPSGSLEVSPQSTTTYTLTAEGPSGTTTDMVTIIVHPPPEVCILAEPSVVDPGQTSTMRWTSQNAYKAFLDNGIGEVNLDGTIVLAPSETTTYTLTIQGEGGIATASVTVTVPETPEVIIAVFPNTVEAGRPCMLSWTSRNADGAFLDNEIGAVAPSGSIEVCPSETTTYTITATGNGGRATTGQVIVTVIQTSGTSPDPPHEGPGRTPP